MRASQIVNHQSQIHKSFSAPPSPGFIRVSKCCKRLVVSAAFLFGELAGAFVQLRGHLGGFFGGTAERDQDFGEFGNFHGKIQPRMNTDKHG